MCATAFFTDSCLESPPETKTIEGNRVRASLREEASSGFLGRTTMTVSQSLRKGATVRVMRGFLLMGTSNFGVPKRSLVPAATMTAKE